MYVCYESPVQGPASTRAAGLVRPTGDIGVDVETVVLMMARASRLENQDAIDTAVVVMLADPRESRAGV
ncbi:hypothetical protein KIW84_012117 [Lathyrus oleraceus]|uniref:Uncharacterized protein n=1 Tax=Pisum sativum TaxID=3888 RepID=A0A9D5BGQ5_PEA|nr:hypothetical protein KIW84_012117 [Pisum sativum]